MDSKIVWIIVLLVLLMIILIWQSIGKTIGISDKNEIIRILVRQSSRWSIAAEQDQNALIALLHANYGAGYLWALQSIATDSEVLNATGINLKQLESAVVAVQDKATRKVSSLCPGFAPSETYLAKIAGDI